MENKTVTQEKNQKWVSEPIRLARAETEARMAGYSGAKWVFYGLAHSLLGEILGFFLVQYLVLFCMWRAMYFDIMDFARDVFLIDPDGAVAMLIQLYSGLLVALVIICYVVFMERRSAASMGFRKNWWILKYIGGAVYGFVSFSAALALVLVLCGGRVQMAEEIPVKMIIFMLFGFLIQGAEEEALYRGFFLTTMARNHNIIIPAALSSVVFALMHVGNPGVNTIALLNISLVGMFLALLFLRTESLWTCCAWHSIWNFVQGNFFGLPVSGLDAGGSVLATQIRQGRDLFTGGEFGVEASACTTVVLLILIVIESFLLSGKYRKYADALEDEAEYQAFMRENGNPAAIPDGTAADAVTDSGSGAENQDGKKESKKELKEIALDDDIPDMPTGWQPSVTPADPDAVVSVTPESDSSGDDDIKVNLEKKTMSVLTPIDEFESGTQSGLQSAADSKTAIQSEIENTESENAEEYPDYPGKGADKSDNPEEGSPEDNGEYDEEETEYVEDTGDTEWDEYPKENKAVVN